MLTVEVPANLQYSSQCQPFLPQNIATRQRRLRNLVLKGEVPWKLWFELRGFWNISSIFEVPGKPLRTSQLLQNLWVSGSEGAAVLISLFI